jgi:hypothetical protein
MTDPAPRLAEIRARLQAATDIPDRRILRDMAYLLDAAERAAALLEALRGSVSGYLAIDNYVNGGDRPRDSLAEQAVYDALTALADALGSEP